MRPSSGLRAAFLPAGLPYPSAFSPKCILVDPGAKLGALPVFHNPLDSTRKNRAPPPINHPPHTRGDQLGAYLTALKVSPLVVIRTLRIPVWKDSGGDVKASDEARAFQGWRCPIRSSLLNPTCLWCHENL